MPDPGLADHLLGGEHCESAPRASAGGLRSVQGTAVGELDGALATGRHQSGGMSVAEALGTEELAVAGAAMDLAVGSVAGQHGVQRAVTVGAVVALLVPHLALGQLLLGSEHGATAPGAALALAGLDRGGVRIVEWPVGANLILGQAISLQEAGAASESIAVGTPLLAVAGAAVDVAIGSIAGVDRVQGLVAVLAVEALLVPLATLRQLLLGGIDDATATRATLTGTGLDLVHLDGGTDLGSSVVVGIAIGLEGTAALTIAIALGTELLGVAALAVDVLVRGLAAKDRVETLLAAAALEALLVPAPAAGQHLFGGIDIATATWTALTLGGAGNGPGFQPGSIPHRRSVAVLAQEL